MIITNANELNNYGNGNRLWQGIPGVAITKNGRIFIGFYSGGVKEETGNFVLVLKSDDDGKTFSSPVTVVYNKDGGRCFDEVLWIDPLGRLWLFWGYMGKTGEGTYASVCENPDSDDLVWSEPKLIGYDVMMNKPVVLSSGEWLFPIAVWEDSFRGYIEVPTSEREGKEKGAFVYKSVDNGKTFVKLGGTLATDRSFDEHMVVELDDGSLMMLIRTTYGIAVSYSNDKGKTWSEPVDSNLKGPNSRFSITKLKSGRYLLINHYDYDGRNNLTALISEDNCKTFKYKLLLDERKFVAYPDVQEYNGYIYITYDRERGAFKKSLDEVYAEAREILLAKITEEDIIQGKVTSKNSYLKKVVSKLTKYEKGDPFAKE